jgi:hypothetical protein
MKAKLRTDLLSPAQNIMRQISIIHLEAISIHVCIWISPPFHHVLAELLWHDLGYLFSGPKRVLFHIAWLDVE